MLNSEQRQAAVSYEDIFNVSFYVSRNFLLTVSDDNITFILHVHVRNNTHVANLLAV